MSRFSPLKVGSLFAGIGGFDLAAQRCGMDVRWGVEIDPKCRSVLSARFPDTPYYYDVKEVTLGRSRPGSAEPVDLLCGGFPCQDVSVAGRRAGLAGGRSGLFYEFARLIEQGRPRWVLIENVPGLLSSNSGRDMGAVLGTLGELGYGYAYRVLDASYFGVPQRRRRVVIVGCLRDAVRAGQVLFEPEGSIGDPASRRGPGASTATGAEKRSANGGEGVLGTVQSLAFNQRDEVRLSRTSYTLQAAPGVDEQLVVFHPTQDPISSVDISHAMSSGNSQGCATIAVAHQCHGTNVGEMSTLRAGNGHLTGGGVPMSVREDQRTGQVYEMPYFSALAGPGGKPGQGYQAVHDGMVVRRLTPTECERLQGFDDDWTDVPDADGKPMSDTARYRMLGNAVAVPVFEWVLGRMGAL